MLPLIAATALCASGAVPGAHWDVRTPEQAGLSRAKLEALAALAQGRGCVVRGGAMVFSWGDPSRSGDVASAMKPVLSTLLMIAVQEGKLAGPDAPVADSDPRLRALNGGKDSGITWRHLASQTSGYGLTEKPGQAYAYNDYAITLYFDTLMDRVYRQPCDAVLASRLAAPLGFEDRFTYDAFGREDRHGRLAVSPRDFARFGLMILRGGTWGSKQIVRRDLVRKMLHSPVAAATPRSSGKDAEMVSGQRSIGGGKNQTAAGPGCYSFNWWINGKDAKGRRFFRDAPPDAFVASGHGGVRTLWVFPSLDMIVSWNDSVINDHDASPEDPNTKCNQAVRLMMESASRK